MKRLCLLIFLLSLTPVSAQYGQVIMNGAVVSPQVLNLIAQRYNTQLPSGRYWYDKQSGAWGYEGSGTQGFVQAGFGLYARCRPRSLEETRVFTSTVGTYRRATCKRSKA